MGRAVYKWCKSPHLNVKNKQNILWVVGCLNVGKKTIKITTHWIKSRGKTKHKLMVFNSSYFKQVKFLEQILFEHTTKLSTLMSEDGKLWSHLQTNFSHLTGKYELLQPYLTPVVIHSVSDKRSNIQLNDHPVHTPILCHAPAPQHLIIIT